MSASWSWVGALVTAISGGTALGIMNWRVKAHSKVIFKDRGGLNIIDEPTCEKNRVQCRAGIVKDVGDIFDRKFKEHAEQSSNELILQELKKLNGRIK